MDATSGITISRDGQQYGPYPLEQVNDYLVTGNLLPTDLAWDEQKSAWVPLAEIPGVKVAPLPPPPPPAGRERNLAVLIIMSIVWWFVMMFLGFVVVGFFAGLIVGVSHPGATAGDGRAAGRWAGEVFGVPIMFVTLGLSIWLTVIGKLPGTRK